LSPDPFLLSQELYPDPFLLISIDDRQDFTLAHEIGHALGLPHVIEGQKVKHRLMTDNGTVEDQKHKNSKRFDYNEEKKIKNPASTRPQFYHPTP
jgi:hypothetical protein